MEDPSLAEWLWLRDKRVRVALVVLLLVVTFVLVYSPHIGSVYLYHYDEWRSMTAARRMVDGIYEVNSFTLQIGFTAFLSLLYRVVSLVDIYQFLPALWACGTAVILYLFAKRLTGRVDVALLSMLFFASIKSNPDNLLGLWYFTPLTFSIPFIYLFIWWFTIGVETDSPRRVIASIPVFLVIVCSHPISASFMIPILALYCGLHVRFFLKHKGVALLLFLIPGCAYLFFHMVYPVDPFEFMTRLTRFNPDWGGFGYLPFTWVYGIVGGVFALVGAILAIRRRHAILVIWPACALVMLVWYQFSQYTLFAPYLRWYYYFALSLPILSAMGVASVLQMIRRLRLGEPTKMVSRGFVVAVLVLVVCGSFVSYWKTGLQRQFIQDGDVVALRYLGAFDAGHSLVIAPWDSSVGAYMFSGHPIVGDYYFLDSRPIGSRFGAANCTEKAAMVATYNISYVVSRDLISCGWKRIYSDGRNDNIYRVAE